MKNVKNWLQFNEGKNYGDLYHGFIREASEDVLYDSLLNILDNGLKFTKRNSGEGIQPMGVLGSPRWEYITGDYLISTSRDPLWVKRCKLTFVLDAEAISDNYKIQPFDVKAPINNRLNRAMRGKMTTDDYLTSTRSRNYEEKIVSKKPGYLSPKYIKQIVLYKPSEDFEKKVRAIDTDIDIKIVK